MYECGTWGHGLVMALAALEECLGSVILEGFSNLNNSVIPCLHGPWFLQHSQA